jgi:hypothetical protein
VDESGDPENIVESKRKMPVINANATALTRAILVRVRDFERNSNRAKKLSERAEVGLLSPTGGWMREGRTSVISRGNMGHLHRQSLLQLYAGAEDRMKLPW